ncbi:hypothetical protein OAK70_02270 [Akkermansiaceae bacterium]|nr:hypothetical protein [Akkermansiaceae bacterium]MDA7532517.1 hypothetical protein [Akkermansiaceae bacterium]MDC0271002.1 hypothetical protein [Akkermansiaceae bacterium]
MSVSIYWEYHFPSMTFWGERVCEKNEDGILTNLSDWHPEEDFKGYLENLAVDRKWFEGDTSYQAKRFEEARVEMLERIEIESQGEEYQKDGFDFDEESVCLPRYKISLKEFNGEVLLSNGEKHSIYAGRNQINVVKIYPLYLVFDWLFTVFPRGERGNDFYIGAYGISEYDETYTDNFQYIQDDQAKLHLQSAYVRAMEPKKVDDDPFSFDDSMSKISYGHKTAEDVRSTIGEMHPSGEIAGWKGCQR